MDNKLKLMNKGILVLFIFLISCADKKNKADLIVIEDVIYGGIQKHFYIGKDSSRFYLSLKENHIILNEVDSHFVYIISKDAFDHLKEIMIDKAENPFINFSKDDFVLKVPKSIKFTTYNEKLIVTTYCLRPQCAVTFNDFSKKIKLDKDTTSKSLIENLKLYLYIDR